MRFTTRRFVDALVGANLCEPDRIRAGGEVRLEVDDRRFVLSFDRVIGVDTPVAYAGGLQRLRVARLVADHVGRVEEVAGDDHAFARFTPAQRGRCELGGGDRCEERFVVGLVPRLEVTHRFEAQQPFDFRAIFGAALRDFAVVARDSDLGDEAEGGRRREEPARAAKESRAAATK